ncbi:hypothetical protein F5Y03DRAFT_255985 [Xylaria venustula]|nr:hypothetical protein F5Y03DRAFT_255985 [Xylaria venustula]
MADHPPGYVEAAEDLQCYNCGMKGHMFFACPEDTRRVPAGLEASRKRQASGNDYQVHAKRSKGPVVTHYPPPLPPGLSHIPPPPISYSPRHGYEPFRSGSPYHPSPTVGRYDQYPPPPNGGRSASGGLPFGNPRDIDDHLQQPPGMPLPETRYRPPYYDQYDEHRPGPPPTAPYGRPYSAPPGRFDEQLVGNSQGPPHTSAQRIPHQVHFEHYPPAPGVDSYHPGAPPPFPPPPSNIYRNSSHYDHEDASLARLYTSGHGSPPPGLYPHQPYQYTSSDSSSYHTRHDRFTDRSLHEPRRRDLHSQRHERRAGENQQNRDRHRRRTRYDSPRGRAHSERRFPDQPARLASPMNSTQPSPPKKGSTSLESSKPQRELSDAVLVNTNNVEKYTVEDFSWEEEAIFKEFPPKITRDLIREPLPVEWTDDPIMPPKYDKETITSRYINPANVDDFALSVRETKAWQVMQFHPAFLAPTDVRVEKLWEYEKHLNPGPTYNKQSRHGLNSSGGGRQHGKSWASKTRAGRQTQYSQHHGQSHSSSEEQLNHYRPGLAKRIWDQTNYRDIEEYEGRLEGSAKKHKTLSPEPGEVCEDDDQEPTTTRSSSPSWEEEYQNVGQNYQNGSTNSLRESGISLPGGKSERDACRLSPQSPTTPTPRGRVSRSPSRASSTRSSHTDRSKPPSRRSSRSNSSQPSSRRNSIGSPLTPTERELLGMRPYSSGSDTGRDSPIPQTNGTPVRPRQRPAKMHAAYQRRW